MATLNFIVVDKTMYKMSDADRIKHIDKRAAEQAAQGKENTWSEKQNPVNPFPKWIREIIKSLGKTTYDRFGETYTVSGIEDDEVEEKESEFKAKLEKARDEEADRAKWFDTYHVGGRSFEVPETDAIDAAED